MKFSTLQWNIGGGLVRAQDIPSLSNQEGYTHLNLDYIISVIKNVSPDIITLQETHQDSNGGNNQINHIAEILGYQYFFTDVYNDSHLEVDQKLCQGIISRFPILDHSFKFFINPKIEVIRPNGEKWITHDKGVSTCSIELPVRKVLFKTLHAVPFDAFGLQILSPELTVVRESMDQTLCPEFLPAIIQGDFNYTEENSRVVLPKTFAKGMQEVNITEPTTVYGKKKDRILYGGLSHISSSVLSKNILTDHFPIESIFEIKESGLA